MAAQEPPPIDLEAALQGRVPALPAKHAVYRLARSGAAGATERLAGLLRQPTAVQIRRRAALGLSLLPDARTTLLEAVSVDEPTVLAAVLLSLARVGVDADVDTIRSATARLTGRAAEQGRFAELLLAHRLGLGREIVPPIPTPVANEAPTRTSEVTSVSPQSAATAWERFVPNASLGFEPDPYRGVVIQCAGSSVLVLPSAESRGEGVRNLLVERRLIGATATYEREDGSWHHDLWIFSTPMGDAVELQAWTQGGLACYVGPGRVVGNELAFELRTTAGSHLALVSLDGHLTSDSLTIHGSVGDRAPSDAQAPEPRQPPPATGAAR
jgi:hypothetical protein